MATNNKPTDSNITPAGANSNASAKTDAATPGKAAARNKQHQKPQKTNPPATKKKQPQVVKSEFEGNASGSSPMKGIVVALANGNLAGQFRVYQDKMA
jgi:hypothetical protein